jgi:hypothetical protein
MIVQLKITQSDIDRAQGGQPQIEHTEGVWVECPDGYNPAMITAEDIVCDDDITVVNAATAKAEGKS